MKQFEIQFSDEERLKELSLLYEEYHLEKKGFWQYGLDERNPDRST